MAHWCDSCGQRLPEGETPADATWLGAPGDDHQHTFAKPTGPKRGGRDKKLLGAVGVALALWGLFVGIGRIVTPDDSIDETAAAEIEEARLEQEADAMTRAVEERVAELEAQNEEARIAEAEGTATLDPDAPIDDGRAEPVVDAANLGARSAISVQVERLQRQLTRRSSSAVVAYRSELGVVVVDMVSGQAVVTAHSDSLGTVPPGAQILRSGAATFAIDPETLQVTQVGDASSLVVGDALDGNTYFVDANTVSQALIVDVVADGSDHSYRMPAGGFQLQPVDGLGLLAVPQGPTGETLIAGVESFTSFSANRVLTGTENAILEQVCETETTCSLVITNLDSGLQVVVPASFVRFGDQYVLSPDGNALLRHSPEGFAEIFLAGTKVIVGSADVPVNDSIAWVVGAGMRTAAWGPNSDFVVWLHRVGDPKLRVMFPDERDWLSIDLRDLGAPPPAGPEVIAFTSIAGSANDQ